MSYCESPTAIRIWMAEDKNEWFVDGIDETLQGDPRSEDWDHYTEWCGAFPNFMEALTVGVEGACKMMGLPYVKADIDRLVSESAFIDDMLIISLERQVAI